MAEETEEEKTQGKDESKKSKLALYVISTIPVVIILSFLLVTKIVNPRFAPPASAEVAGDVSDAKDDEPEEIYMCDLGTILANPLGSKRIRIMKVSVSVELASEDLVLEVEKAKPKLQHQLIMILSSKDLQTVCSSQGKAELQEEIKNALVSEMKLKPGEMRQFYFGEFVVQ